MSGTVFTHVEGYLQVAFKPGAWGDIDIDLRFHGEGEVHTLVDDHWQQIGTKRVFAEGTHIIATTSPTTSAFFRNLVAWLEAIICGVYQCSFRWEAEGPEGCLSWNNHHDNRGQLHLTWEGTRQRPDPVDHRVLLSRPQMVRAFYEGMRRMVASPEYCLLDNEPVTLREWVEHVFDADDQIAFVETLAGKERTAAFAMLNALLNFGYSKERGQPRQASLSVFSDVQPKAESGPDHDAQVSAWFDLDWDRWSIEERRSQILKGLFPGQAWYSSGERISAMRSEHVESWLAEQAEIPR